MNKNPTVLIILDGYGCSDQKEYNAIYHAKKPNLDYYFKHFPHAKLHASGKYVGLPENFVGNSQVGHLTIGAGKVIDQPAKVLLDAIENKSFFENKSLNQNLQKLAESKKTLHIMGLLSNAGVHSIEAELYAFMQAAINNKIKQIYIHAFLDGRDGPPKYAINYLTKLDNFIKDYDFIKFGSVHGRFYAMDRDQNWQRTQQSYDVLTQSQKIDFKNWQEAIDYYYSKNITDEFIPPTQLDQNAIVNNKDGIIFYNFRPDRARQLTQAFVQKDFDYFKTKNLDPLFFITPVSYGENIKTTVLFPDLFPEKKVKNSLLDILAEHKLLTFSIAETEKYAHITYFIRGGREEPLPSETQILIESIKSKNYVDFPCMSAEHITQTVLKSLKTNPKDFYLINYANADMVGHSGNFDATVKAIECLDKQLGELYDQVILKQNGTIYITADHGNAEIKFNNETGQISTGHTTNPVPFIFIKKELENNNKCLDLSSLADIKHFILKNFEIY